MKQLGMTTFLLSASLIMGSAKVPYSTASSPLPKPARLNPLITSVSAPVSPVQFSDSPNQTSSPKNVLPSNSGLSMQRSPLPIHRPLNMGSAVKPLATYPSAPSMKAPAVLPPLSQAPKHISASASATMLPAISTASVSGTMARPSTRQGVIADLDTLTSTNFESKGARLKLAELALAERDETIAELRLRIKQLEIENNAIKLGYEALQASVKTEATIEETVATVIAEKQHYKQEYERVRKHLDDEKARREEKKRLKLLLNAAQPTSAST